MSTLYTHNITGLLIGGQWVRPRPGSVRLVPGLITDTSTPGCEQICTLPGVRQELMTDQTGIPQTGVDNPQQLTWVHESQSRRFFCDPKTVQAWQVEESESIAFPPLPESAVDFAQPYPHLTDD